MYNGTVLSNTESVNKEKDLKGISKSIIVNESNGLQVQIAEKIAEALNNKGAKMKVTKLKADRYYKQIEAKDYEMAIIGIAGIEDSRILDIVAKLNTLWIDEKSNIERKELLKQLELKLKEQYSFLPIARETKKAYISQSLIVGQNFEGITNFNMFTNIGKWYRK